MVAGMSVRWRGLALAMGLLLGATVGDVALAELNCRAEINRHQVAGGGQVILTLNAAGNLSQQPRHDPPQIPGVDVIPGGTSQSYSISGGKAEMSVSITYYLQVRDDQDFTVPAVVFTAGGESCATKPIAVAVVAAPAPSQTGNRVPAPRAPSSGEEPTSSGEAAGGPGDTAFITLTVDRHRVWVGEQIQLVFRYHRRRNSWDQPQYTAPRTEGFWRLDLPPERRYRKSLQGQVYDVTELRYALFATRSGDLTIEPARLTLPGDPFERFFGRRGRSPKSLETDPIAITVRDLPLPRPQNFSGIVADQLEFTATVDRDTVPRGEPVGLTLEVDADGFLKSFAGIELPEPEGLRLHDASESLREDVTGPRYRAHFKQEKAVVPTREGTVELPSLELVFFDTGRGDYATASASIPPLVVTPSDLPVAGDDPSGFRRTEIARLGRDLTFVRGVTGSLREQRQPLPRHPLWWAVLIAPWGLLGLYRIQLHRQAADRRDPQGRRRRTAWNRAQREIAGLRQGGEAADLARVVIGYVADRTGRNAAGFTAAEVQAFAVGLGSPDAGERLAAILAACDQARFGTGTVDVSSLADEAGRLLGDLDRTAGKASGGTAVAGLTILLVAGALTAAGPSWAQDAAGSLDAAPGVDPARLLAEGNIAYTDGDLDLAVRLYRQAVTLGADDARLHFNLGNALARRGELGRAIASYLRAQRLAPRDGDTRTNLAWVRSHTRDLELAGGGLPPVVTQLDDLAHTLSVDEWAVVLVILGWLIAVLIAWS